MITEVGMRHSSETLRKNIFILSLPRSGSSMIARLICSAGFTTKIRNDSVSLGPSEFNQHGYYEETRLTLLNDQLIRMMHGESFSFLHLPSKESALKNFATPKPYINSLSKNFSYDLDQTTVYLPPGFVDNVSFYTGNTWDNWGLTRMAKGQKWYQCYERYGCKTAQQIFLLAESYTDIFSQPKNLIIKDPRLCIVFSYYRVCHPKIIVITRNEKSVLSSMKKHYGSNLFTKKTLENNNKIVSNHFNYKIPYQNFVQYLDTYQSLLSASVQDAELLTVQFEELVDRNKKCIASLEEFLESRVNSSLIDPNLVYN